MNVEAYARAAFDAEVAKVLEARPGDRSQATFRAASALGNLVGANAISRELVATTLMDAAVAAGLPAAEARGHIDRGIRRGEQTPRNLGQVGGSSGRSSVRPRAPRPTHRAPKFPPGSEVRALWEDGLGITEDREVVRVLNERRLDPRAVEDWDLARVIRRGASLPSWASMGSMGPWSETGHRLMVRTWDSDGKHTSIRARRIEGDVCLPKSLAPTGFSTKGLILADPLGQQLLGGEVLDWWDPAEVVISEGEFDWLTWASRQREEREQGPAFLGVVAGGWSTVAAARIPDGARVAIRTDHDPAGESYASEIARSLQGRCEVHRSIAGTAK